MEDAYSPFDWQQQRDKLRARWDRISDAQFDEIAGDRGRLLKRIQETYGVSAEEAARQLAEWENAQGRWDPSSAEGPAPVPPAAAPDDSFEPGTSGMKGPAWRRPPEWERESDFDSEANPPRDPQLERMQGASGSKVHGDKLGRLIGAQTEESKAHTEAARRDKPRKK